MLSSKAGDFNGAFQILSSLPNPNSSSWNTILTSYVNGANLEKVLSFPPILLLSLWFHGEVSSILVLSS